MKGTVQPLELQVQNESGDRVAGFFHAEDAAMFVGGRDGYTITYMRRPVWEEGTESFSAYESCDQAASVMHERMAVAA